ASGIAAPPMMSAGFSEASMSAVEIPRAPDIEPAATPPAMETSSGPVVPPPSPLPPPLPPTTGTFTAPLPPRVPPPPGAASQPPVAAAIAWPRAGFLVRLGALAIDGVLIGLIMSLIAGLLPRALEIESGPGGWLLALAIYGAVMWKNKGTTIGGIICGLKVVRADNRALDWSTAIVRALACFLSLAVVGLGFIWVAIDDEKQSWHDKIAGTVVVVAPKGVSLV
ncbi:MAG: RDD family protein, partial [Opitutaceae bacterium]